jgi:cobalamin biosynthesis protein CobC
MVMMNKGTSSKSMTADHNLLPHGGNRSAFARQFPNATEPFVDLSTGINPFAYPLPAFPQTALTLLPQEKDLKMLKSVAAQYFNAPSLDYVLPVAGTQGVIAPLLRMLGGGKLAIRGPTYSGYARAAQMEGMEALACTNLDELENMLVAVVANPNNPDGRLYDGDEIRSLAERMARNGRTLIVDEAFMDAKEGKGSAVAAVKDVPLVVLRSFGKFFGLAGIRLGFVIAQPAFVSVLEERSGPWAVSGPALFAGITALQDQEWVAQAKLRLQNDGARLKNMLEDAGCLIIGGTNLFCLVERPDAAALYRHLGERGIMVRAFAESPQWLRFGLPGVEAEWERLKQAMETFLG